MSLVEDFAELFEGRKDAYGTEEGGRSGTVGSRDGFEPHGFLPTTWHRHLEGTEPIGVYPLVAYQQTNTDMGVAVDWRVKWGCVDFDVRAPGKTSFDYDSESDAHDMALNLVDILATFGITGWVERTKSGGRHVWVFAETWVPAATMRRALFVACELVGASTREVNPKSEGEGQPPEFLGNYVRLPYPGLTDQRAIYDPNGVTFLPVAVFVQQALALRDAPSVLEELAKHYVEPKRVVGPSVRVYSEVGTVDLPKELTSKLGGLAFTILNEGPLEDGDRSTTLARLAHLTYEDGLTPDEGLAVITAADWSWGKFHNRVNGEAQLERMIEQAFADWEG